jgi:hypothetical protein
MTQSFRTHTHTYLIVFQVQPTLDAVQVLLQNGVPRPANPSRGKLGQARQHLLQTIRLLRRAARTPPKASLYVGSNRRQTRVRIALRIARTPISRVCHNEAGLRG